MPPKLLISIIPVCFILMFSLNGHSGEIYVCNGNKGSKSFQDFPCSGRIAKPLENPDGDRFQKKLTADDIDFSRGKANGLSNNLARGKAIFEHGKKDVPACNACHGADGKGDIAPRLAGKDIQFLYNQLNDYANNTRQDVTMFVMNAYSRDLSDQERRDLASYANSLGKTSINHASKPRIPTPSQAKEASILKTLENFIASKVSVERCMRPTTEVKKSFETKYKVVTNQAFRELVKRNPGLTTGQIGKIMLTNKEETIKAIKLEIETNHCVSPVIVDFSRRYFEYANGM